MQSNSFYDLHNTEKSFNPLNQVYVFNYKYKEMEKKQNKKLVLIP